MMIFQCKKCNKQKKLMKATLEIVDEKIRTKEARCECGNFMVEVEKQFDGFPSVIRTEPTLNKS